MDSARKALLDTLTTHAEHGWVCPSLKRLAQTLVTSPGHVSTMLENLREAGKITWQLKHAKPHGQRRIVTIVATGKSTGEPGPGKKIVDTRPAFSPTPMGSPVRILEGAAFLKRKQELEARDKAERRRGVA